MHRSGEAGDDPAGGDPDADHNRRFGLGRLLLIEHSDQLDHFHRRITLEYVLIAGRNDAASDADALARLAKRSGALINLLPLHPGGAPDLTPSSRTQMLDFERRLKSHGVEAVLRRSRGLDISAACGQLRVEVESRRKVAAE